MDEDLLTCISLPHCSKLLFTHRWGGHMHILLTESGRPPAGYCDGRPKVTEGDLQQLQESHSFHYAELSVLCVHIT